MTKKSHPDIMARIRTRSGRGPGAAQLARLVPRCAGLVLGCAALVLGLNAAPATAQEKAPEQSTKTEQARLIDSPPFDQLTLKLDQKVLKLQPLELDKRVPFVSPPVDNKLRLRLYDNPAQRYEVSWPEVASLKLFEELVLEEAAHFVAEGDFDAAYEDYQFLEQRDAKFPGVAEGWQSCLFQEARSFEQQKNFDQALALLIEVHRRNPQFAGLDQALGNVLDPLIERRVQSGQLAAARQLLAGLAAKVPQHPLLSKRQQQFQQEAAQALQAAQQAEAAGKPGDAHRAATRAVAWGPQLKAAVDLLKKVHAEYPVLSVGVQDLGGRWGQGAWPDFATRRQVRLQHRLLCEPAGYTDQGIRYTTPLGSWESQGSKWSLKITSGMVWPNQGGPVTAFDVAAGLTRRANRSRPEYDPRWADLCGRLQVRDRNQLELELTRPASRPEALWQIPLVPWSQAGASSAAQLSNGPYAVLPGPADASARTYAAQPGAWGLAKESPREIMEIRYSDSASAIRALHLGEVVALDRVPPWEVANLARRKDLTVAAYAAPTVHFLVPRDHHPWLSRREVRRALAYGLSRERILKDTLKIADSAQGRLLASPFPVAVSAPETGSHFPYDARLMLALLETAGKDLGPLPKLVLAHPPSATARQACLAIQDQWGLEGLGPRIELLEIAPSDAYLNATWDLLYVEWPALDPFQDGPLLFGAGGLVGSGHPWLTPLVVQISRAPTLEEARGPLAELQELAARELPVLPLWQTTEYYVTRKLLEGAARSPLSLYQSIEDWRHPPLLPQE